MLAERGEGGECVRADGQSLHVVDPDGLGSSGGGAGLQRLQHLPAIRSLRQQHLVSQRLPAQVRSVLSIATLSTWNVFGLLLCVHDGVFIDAGRFHRPVRDVRELDPAELKSRRALRRGAPVLLRPVQKTHLLQRALPLRSGQRRHPARGAQGGKLPWIRSVQQVLRKQRRFWLVKSIWCRCETQNDAARTSAWWVFANDLCNVARRLVVCHHATAKILFFQ